MVECLLELRYWSLTKAIYGSSGSNVSSDEGKRFGVRGRGGGSGGRSCGFGSPNKVISG